MKLYQINTHVSRCLQKKLIKFFLFVSWMLMTGCCDQGCSYCPCKAPADNYILVNKNLAVALLNMKNTIAVFECDSEQIRDTITFKEITYFHTRINGYKCNKPRNTCCNLDITENYTLIINSTRKGSFETKASSSQASFPIGNSFNGNDTLKTVKFGGVLFDDVLITNNGKDTLGLLSVSKGILSYRDRYNAWKRTF